jgi:hypothetical protein
MGQRQVKATKDIKALVPLHWTPLLAGTRFVVERPVR